MNYDVGTTLVETARLEALVRAARGGNDTRLADLERIRFRRVSWMWCIGVTIAMVSAVGYYDKARLTGSVTYYIMAVLGFVSFLCFWRAMYVETNTRYNAVGTFICITAVVMSQ
jgi:hypothetical protein